MSHSGGRVVEFSCLGRTRADVKEMGIAKLKDVRGLRFLGANDTWPRRAAMALWSCNSELVIDEESGERIFALLKAGAK